MEIHAAMVDRMDQNIGRLVKKVGRTRKVKKHFDSFSGRQWGQS